MSNNIPEKLPKKVQSEEHKLNALAKEFQTSLFISQNPYNNPMPNVMPYQNYYPRYPEFNFGYPSYNYPGIPYNYGTGQAPQGAEDFYQPEKNSFVQHFFLFKIRFLLEYEENEERPERRRRICKDFLSVLNSKIACLK